MPLPNETDGRFAEELDTPFTNANEREKVELFKNLVSSFLQEPQRANGSQARHTVLQAMALFEETPSAWLDETLFLSVAKLATLSGDLKLESLALQARRTLLALTRRFPLIALQSFRRAVASNFETTKRAAQYQAQALVKADPVRRIQQVWEATAKAAFDHFPSVRVQSLDTIRLILRKNPDRAEQINAGLQSLAALDSQPSVRRAAQRAVGMMAFACEDPAQLYVPLITQTGLHDTNYDVRLAAHETLRHMARRGKGMLGQPTRTDLLKAALFEPKPYDGDWSDNDELYVAARRSLCVIAQTSELRAHELLEETLPFLKHASENVRARTHLLVADLVTACPFLGNEELLKTAIRHAAGGKQGCVREAAHESVRAQIRANKGDLSDPLVKTLTRLTLFGKYPCTRAAGVKTLETLLTAKPSWTHPIWQEMDKALMADHALALRGALDVAELLFGRDPDLMDGLLFNKITGIALCNEDFDIRAKAEGILTPLMEKRPDLTGGCFLARLEESSKIEGSAAQSLLCLFIAKNAARAGSARLARIGQRGLDTKLGWRTRVDAQTAFCAAMRNLVETDSTQLNADLVATLRDTALRAYNPARGEDALQTIHLVVQKRPDLADKDLAIFMRYMAKRGDTPHLCDLAEINLSLIESAAPDAARAAAPPRPSRGFPMACFG